ncbi:MAG TPA: cyclic nucleotide-binding domain-containing protein [Anaeromyxobacter sp.]|nr:cyclic nucleotide-binding domain-containing protein [Anaeromyxobacter sp.]
MQLVPELKKVEIFKDLPESGLHAIAAVAEIVTLGAGDVVIVEGGPADALYVIRYGSCRIYKEKGGDQQEVVLLGEGSHLGSSALLDRRARSATVVAAEPTELIAFRAERLLEVLEKDPRLEAAFYRAFAKSVFQRLRRTTDDLGLARLQAAERRGA